jgi:probable addiction module antidote protein
MIKLSELSEAELNKLGLSEWDMANHIQTEEDVVGYLNAALAMNDIALLFETLGDIARSEGMKKMAERLGVSRESLYRSLSVNGNPLFSTIVKTFDELGYQLSVSKKEIRDTI